MQAYAKINLFLLVGGRRSDGLHELVTLTAPISLADTIEVEILPGEKGVTVVCNFSPELDRHMKASLDAEQYLKLNQTLNSSENITAQALSAFNLVSGDNCGAIIKIRKCAPVFAGLGGGSADAAAVLLEINRQRDNRLSLKEIYEIARSVGSDVSQALRVGPSLVSGAGEYVVAVESSQGLLKVLSEEFGLIIIKPNLSVSTKEAYRGLRRGLVDNESVRLLTDRSKQLCEAWGIEANPNGGLSDDIFENDFYPYMESVAPEVKDIKIVAKRHGCEYVFMSGSGSSFVGLCRLTKDGSAIANNIKRALPEEYFVEYAKLICKC